MKTKLLSLAAGFLLIAATGCGDNNESGTGASPSASASTSTSGRAASAVSDIVLSGALKGSGGGANQGTKKTLAKILAKTTQSFEESFTESVDCHSGSGSETGKSKGEIVVDDKTGELTSLSLEIDMNGILTDCTEADDPATTGFDESKVAVSGSYKGEGHIDLKENDLTLPLKVEGSITVAGEACPGGGALSFALSCDAKAAIPASEEADADFSGTAGGSFKGNLCGTAVDCTISGNCEAPQVSGTGCE